MHFITSLVAALAVIPATLARPSRPHAAPEIETVFQLDQNYTWFENMAVQASGNLLVTRTDVPEIWTIDPVSKTGSLLVSVPGVSALLGIVETEPDVFVFAAANFTFQTGFATGSAQMWELSFCGKNLVPEIRLIAELPETGLPNGVVQWDDETVLFADTSKGQVIKLDINTGTATSVLEDSTMLPTPNITLQFGINGIEKIVLDGQTYLYYTNTELGLFCRVPLHPKTAEATGPVEVIVRGIPGDDLLMLPDGTALIADNAENTIDKVTPDGNNYTFAGSTDSLALASATSLKFGRTKKDSHILYVATAGGYLTPVNGTVRAPASVAAVDLGSKSCQLLL